MKPIGAASCTPQDTAAKAATAMRDSECGRSPVVEDRENLKLVGVATEREICHSVAAEDIKASEISVEKIMGAASSCCGLKIGGIVIIIEGHECRMLRELDDIARTTGHAKECGSYMHGHSAPYCGRNYLNYSRDSKELLRR